MTVTKIDKIFDWLLKQAPVIIVLIYINYNQYNRIVLLEAKVEILQEKCYNRPVVKVITNKKGNTFNGQRPLKNFLGNVQYTVH